MVRIWRTLFAKRDDQLVTLAQAAHMLGVGPGAAARLVRAGQLPKTQVAGEASQYHAADVRELAARVARPRL